MLAARIGTRFQLHRFLHRSVLTTDCPHRSQILGEGQTDGGPSATLSTSFTYSTGLTATVTQVEPSRGTSVGGTTVTLTGTGFGLKADGSTATTTSDISVWLSGIACAVSSVSSTTIECVTGYRNVLADSTVVVSVADKGYAAASGMSFQYIDLWSATTTWGGLDPPVAGDSVVIPAGQNVLLDISPPQLYLVLIEGRLEFDTTKDLTFDASYIFLNGKEAHLQVSSLLPLPPHVCESRSTRVCVA